MTARKGKSQIRVFTLGGGALLGECSAAFEEKKALQILMEAAILDFGFTLISAETFIAGSDPSGLFAPCVKWMRSIASLPFRKFGCTTTCNL